MMTTIDYIVLVGYLVGVLFVGVLFSSANKNTSEMFSAGSRSPWWAAGISSYMTMFSAGTFVVWGGIAFKHGLVAITINLCYGVAAILVGYFVAGRWKELGISTPAEYVKLRFGESALHFYTWSIMLFRIIGSGVGLYSLAILFVAMMPLSEGNFLRDPQTGLLSMRWAILLLGGVVVAYTLVGGLWGVLITDVVQSIVINLAVLFVVPLSLKQVGGIEGLIDRAPAGFFSPISGGYTWYFMFAWCAIHFFMIGADWAFVQRFLCVPTPRDARKGSYLFGILYLVSPFVWLLPPLVWRIQHPLPQGVTDDQINRVAEQAYIHSCQTVLPHGMLGMMMAAMFSATASGLSGQLNVFAGVLTENIYRPLARSNRHEGHFVWVGRLFTLLLGIVVIGIAMTIRGAEAIVIAITTLACGTLLAPMLWGLFSRKIGTRALWLTALGCLPLITLIKLEWIKPETICEAVGLTALAHWFATASYAVDITLSFTLPIVILLVLQLAGKNISPGWIRLSDFQSSHRSKPVGELHESASQADHLPTLVIACSLLFCATTMAWLALINETNQEILWFFVVLLLLIAVGLLWNFKKQRTMISSSQCKYDAEI